MAPPNDIMRASPAMSESGELSAGSVVFALPHIRDAIFEYHAQVTLEQKARALARVPRRMSDSLWANLSGSSGSYAWSSYASYCFPYRVNTVAQQSSFFDLMERLGLSPALWIDVVLSRPHDTSAWLIAFSHYRKSTSLALDATPYSRQGSNYAFEHPDADPLEMLLYSTTGNYYRTRNWRPADVVGLSFTQLFRDSHGQLVVARLVDSRRKPFLLQASQKCPALLYSVASPLFPVNEVLPWSPQHDAAVYIWRMPPWPLSSSLAMGQEEMSELRRVMERARDLFAHLVTLQKHGVSLDIQMFRSSWPWCLALENGDPTVLPAYLSPRITDGRGKTSADLWEEQLPVAPQRAWPMTALGNKRGDTHSLPWSQFAAYADQRVEGPRYFLHSVNSVSWTEAAAQDKRSSWYAYQRTLTNTAGLRNRFHSDLLAVTHDIVESMTSRHYMGAEDIIRLLDKDVLSHAYEAWHSSSIDCLPGASTAKHSKLFTTCYFCLRDGRASGPPTNSVGADMLTKGECPSCGRAQRLAVTIPEAMRQLLLRIARPGKLQDGTDDIVTAKEALDVMNGVLESEIPRLKAFFERWAEAQPEPLRLTKPVEVRLPLVLGDDRAHRWVELEMLRGNYLDEKFSREEFNKMRDFIKNDLTPLQKQKRDEFRLACGDDVEQDEVVGKEGEGAQDEKQVQQPPKRGRRSAAAAASTSAAGNNDAAEEAESSSSGAKKGAKRGGGSSSKGSTTKKAKKKKK